MEDRGDFGSEGNVPSYTPNQVGAVLNACGVEIVGETGSDYLCLCPFHGNYHTPSFSVSKTKGGKSFICFNAACNETGTLVELVKRTTKRDEFAARRMIAKKRGETQEAYMASLQEKLNPAPTFPSFDQSKLDEMVDAFWKSDRAIQYMKSRKFTEETLRYFEIGYSAKKDMIAVPMHDPNGNPVGIIGRSIADKQFKNSKKLPTSKTLWNLHRAKKTGGTVIIQEASFDSMRVHQIGYQNTVSCLGGYFSASHFDLINKHFDTIIIMTDFDKKEKHIYNNCKKCKKRGLNLCAGHNPGRDLGETIAAGLRNKRILWASYDKKIVYPHDAKDAGDMEDDEILQTLKNPVSNFEYHQWKVY